MAFSELPYEPQCPSVGWLVNWFVFWEVGHYFLKRQGSHTSVLLSEEFSNIMYISSVYNKKFNNMEIAKPVFKFIAEILMISPIDSIKKCA